MMTKFYRNLTDYAKQNGMCRQTASSKFNKGEIKFLDVPKGAKWYEEEFPLLSLSKEEIQESLKRVNFIFNNK